MYEQELDLISIYCCCAVVNLEQIDSTGAIFPFKRNILLTFESNQIIPWLQQINGVTYEVFYDISQENKGF